MEPFRNLKGIFAAVPLGTSNSYVTPSNRSAANFGANHHRLLLPQALPTAGPSVQGYGPPSPRLDHTYNNFKSPLPALWALPSQNSESIFDGVAQPSTPPSLDDEDFNALRQWHAQEKHKDHANTPPLSFQTRSQIYPNYTPYFPQYSNYRAQLAANRFDSPHCTLLYQNRHDDLRGYQSQQHDNIVAVPRYLPPISSSLQSPFIQSRCSLPLSQGATAPSVQQWPTHNLSHQHRPSIPTLSGTPLVSPSPDQARVDEKTRRKQERYRQKGEALRAARKQGAPLPRKRPGRKRKPCSMIDTLFPETMDSTILDQNVLSDHPSSEQHICDYEPMDWQPQHQSCVPYDFGPFHHYIPPANDEPSVNTALPLASPVQVDWDDLNQPITQNYEDYKWSIELFEMVTDGAYDFAQPFLEDLFVAKGLYGIRSQYKWHAHSTKGFIKEGNRLSFIVLHNAVNPFQWGIPPESTTTIGVYGRYWNEADKEIHWKTFAPSIREHVQEFLNSGYFSLKFKWRVDMDKASDRRFHRAYWHAANITSLKGLLNHAGDSEPSHDVLNDEEGLTFQEKDLDNSWKDQDIAEEEANKVWAKILQHNEDMHVPTDGYEHVVTGCSEWDLYD